MSNREMAEEATRLLRAHGYTASGRDRRDSDYNQYRFEKRLVVVPFRGASRRRR